MSFANNCYPDAFYYYNYMQNLNLLQNNFFHLNPQNSFNYNAQNNSLLNQFIVQNLLLSKLNFNTNNTQPYLNHTSNLLNYNSNNLINYDNNNLLRCLNLFSSQFNSINKENNNLLSDDKRGPEIYEKIVGLNEDKLNIPQEKELIPDKIKDSPQSNFLGRKKFFLDEDDNKSTSKKSTNSHKSFKSNKRIHSKQNNEKNLTKSNQHKKSKSVEITKTIENLKSNTNLPLKFIGTIEEYNNFFKNDKNSKNFTKQELELIDFVNKPRKRKNKQILSEKQSQNDFLSTKQRKVVMTQELSEYLPRFQADLESLRTDKRHKFMSENFKEMYNNIETFYYFTGNIKKKEKSHIKIPSKIYNYEKVKSKKIWKSEKYTSENIEDFISKAFRFWPSSEYMFSEEIALELLYINNYDQEKILSLIKSKHPDFISRLKNRKLEICMMMR